MGCDIHLYTEVQKRINDNLIWTCCDNWQIDPYEIGKYDINPIWSTRNYHIFSVLANVRNDNDNIPICELKGLPSDISDAIKEASDRWGCDGHSHSWLTLKEIKDYLGINQQIKYSGLMLPDEAAKVDAGEMPSSWCKSTTADDHVYREWSRENRPLKEFIALLNERKRDELWIFSDEQDTPESDEKFRIVFWFDN